VKFQNFYSEKAWWCK